MSLNVEEFRDDDFDPLEARGTITKCWCGQRWIEAKKGPRRISASKAEKIIDKNRPV